MLDRRYGSSCRGEAVSGSGAGVNLGELAQLAPQLQPSPTGENCEPLTLKAVAKGTVCQDIRLTDMAWDYIESADGETREFLYQLCQLKCRYLELYQTFVATYENPVVRELAMASWRNELSDSQGIPPEIMEMVPAEGHDRA